MPKQIHIHFVCRGNTFRSRLAAAYISSVQDDRFMVSSSGVHPQSSTKTTEVYTRHVGKAHGLSYQLYSTKLQTTDAMLAAADIVVFMDKSVFDDAARYHSFDARKAVVWQIPDVPDSLRQEAAFSGSLREVFALAEHIFDRIRQRCDELYRYVSIPQWTDIYSADNTPTGLRLPIDWVSDRGLWHRGIRVVLLTSNGKFVVTKRSEDIVFAPGMLEVSLGGALDCDETPIHAARREVFEELGVRLPPTAFKQLFIYKLHSYHPRYQKRTKAFIYTYVVRLPQHSAHFKLQSSEVAAVRTLSRREVWRLLRQHRIDHFGRLMWTYMFYRQAVTASIRSEKSSQNALDSVK